MKTAETKTSSTANSFIQAKRQPFFSKGGHDGFFSKTNKASNTFFTPSSVQAKLTIGQPNDKYEVEADAMADKVVQRLHNTTPVQQFGYVGNTALQSKCDSCEDDEKIQKQEEETTENLEKESEIQTKPIFESETQDLAVQAKTENSSATGNISESISKINNINSLTLVQQKCENCEEEEIKENSEQHELQRKISVGASGDADDEDPDIQRRASEMEKTEYPILFKKTPGLQMKSSGASTGSRERIVEEAKKMLGKIEAKKDDGSGRRVGAEYLLEIFHLAAKDTWSDEVIKNVQYTDQFPHWCGIFSVYAIKKAGIDLGFWEVGVGVSRFNTLEPTDYPQPGDIGYFTQKQHHCIIKEVNGDTIVSIDGNSGNFSEVKELTRPRSKFHAFFTPFTGSEKIIQKEGGTGAESQSSESDLQDKLTSSAGNGSSMDTQTRNQMESGFGMDFGDVNIHTDSSAVQMNKNLNAQAFTHGNDIYFNEGKYDPDSKSGQHLLAHELTHTIQQGASVNKKTQPEIPIKTYSNSTKPNVQRDLIDDAIELGGTLVDSTTSRSLRPLLERYVPGLWDFIDGGMVDTFKEKVFKGISKVFKRVQKAIQSGALTQKIRQAFSGTTEKLKNWRKDVADFCGGFYEGIQMFVDFLGELTDPFIQDMRKKISDIAEIAKALWDDFGKPAWSAIKKFAKEAWNWIKTKAQWLWDVTAPIRQTLEEAWNWIKTQLGILSNSASSIWNAIKQKIAEIWNDIKGYIQPILRPLKVIGAILLLISPMGPVVLVYKGAPYVWNALKWVYNNWKGWETLMMFKEYFSTEILPVLKQGVEIIKGFIDSAKKWIEETVNEIKTEVKKFLDATGVLDLIDEIKSFIGKVKLVLGEVRSAFSDLVESIKSGFSPIFNAISQLFSALYQCIKPIITFVTGIVTLVAAPVLWPIYIIGLVTRLAWWLLPRDLKLVAIDYIIRIARSAFDYLKPAAVPDVIWSIQQAGADAFFGKIQGYNPDTKIRFVEKILNLLIDPQTYGGLAIGMITGFVRQAIDLIVGTISLLISMPNIIVRIVDILRRLIPNLEFLERIKERMDAIIMQLQRLINLDTIIQDITNYLRNAPQALAEFIQDSVNTGREQMREWGEQFAERMVSTVLSMNNFNVGFAIGDIIGRLIFEIVLTKGIGFILSKIPQAVSWLRRGLRTMQSGARSVITKIFTKAREIFSRIIENLRRFFQRLGEELGRLFGRFKALWDDFVAWILRALRGGAQDRAQWLAFLAQVRVLTSGINSGYEGKNRREAAGLFNAVRLPFNGVAGIPLTPETKTKRLVNKDNRSGYWKLMARKKFGILSPLDRTVGTEVGRMLMKRVIPGPADDRWELGKRAVRTRIDEGFSESQLNKRSLDRILEPFKEDYKYRRLEAVWDSHESDWNIMASMSPKKSIARFKSDTPKPDFSKTVIDTLQRANTTNQEIDEVSQYAHLPDGSYSNPIPIHWFKTGQILVLNGLTPKYSRWAINNQPPSQTIDAAINDQTELEIPPRLFRSWQGVSSSKTVGGRNIRVVTIGVHRRYNPNICKKMKRTRSTGLLRRMQGKFRTLLNNWNFDWNMQGGRYDADHVQDMGWGGQSMDVVNNMWPLEYTLNRENGNRTYHQTVEYREGNNRRTGTPYTLTNKWFQIRSIGANRSNNFPEGTSSC